MLRRRLLRLGPALFVAWSLLFAQLALASYACPARADAAAMAAMMQAGLPCEGMDPQQPVLCHQHAADPGKTADSVKLPVLSLPAVVLVLERPLLLDAAAARARPAAAAPEARPPPDPLFLTTQRLRV